MKKVFWEKDIIFNQGDTGKEMYVIITGHVQLILHDEDGDTLVLKELKESEFFGEMCLFGNHRRTATAVAVKNTSVHVINSDNMKNQLDKLPDWFYQIFKELISRIRKTDRRLIYKLMSADQDEKK
ncbi:MAG: cyclic nucleotide-binding domain-containing protein [bacterium]|nr:cyclic nucleotide-binding domain-containing protein [bacterium]